MGSKIMSDRILPNGCFAWQWDIGALSSGDGHEANTCCGTCPDPHPDKHDNDSPGGCLSSSSSAWPVTQAAEQLSKAMLQRGKMLLCDGLNRGRRPKA